MSKNLIDIVDHQNTADQIAELTNLSKEEINKLSPDQKNQHIHLITKLLKTQSKSVVALMNDVSLLIQSHELMKEQFTHISCQSFLALQMIKEKGLVTKEEIEKAWLTLVKEKILDPESDKLPSSGNLLNSEQTSESD